VKTRLRNLIKFQDGALEYLRARLFKDLSREHFAILLGKTQQINGITLIKVIDILFLEQSDYHQQSAAFLRIKKDFVHRALVELVNRYDVDTLIDIHTHPFSQSNVAFSATDDGDEQTFFQFLQETFVDINYASIVFSQRRYSARVWTLRHDGIIVAGRALLKTQTLRESIMSADDQEYVDGRSDKTLFLDQESFFNRSTLVLGLDVMRSIVHDQVISIVGVGGLGSIIAEHLLHMGFHEINLIDPDTLEISNLNRVVGAYYEDAQRNRPKVDVVKRHLTSINPSATVMAYQKDIHDQEMESVLALSDWLIVATDTHNGWRWPRRFILPTGNSSSLNQCGVCGFPSQVPASVAHLLFCP
jgi:molybdopterin-synthase adenylyltransferase